MDRIVELVPGERIVTDKTVSLAEEYLADHFPTFPVLPGVLMLEAMAQSAAWLVRATQDFHPSLILLNEARNVTYTSFVRPGQTLRMDIHCRRMEEGSSDYQGRGTCEQTAVVKARFSLRHHQLAEQNADFAGLDERMRQASRGAYEMLCTAS